MFMKTNRTLAGMVAVASLFMLWLPTVSAAGAAQFEDGSSMSAIVRVTYISFVGIGLVFIASAFFLFMERNDVARRHRPAVGLGVMIVGIAGFQYALMQDIYLTSGSIPTDFRYADWIITVPLMAITFAVLAGKESFTKHRMYDMPGMSVPGVIIVASMFMMVFGYAGQTEVDAALASGSEPPVIHWYYFFLGTVGLLTVLVVVGTPFTGAYGIDHRLIADASIQLAIRRMRLLILGGWLVYPVGYVVGALQVGGDDGGAWMMLTYNIADLINKVAFVVIVLIGARSTEEAEAVYRGHLESANTT